MHLKMNELNGPLGRSGILKKKTPQNIMEVETILFFVLVFIYGALQMNR